jgi:hypothetical protein
MQGKKKVTVVIESCVNCPCGRYEDSEHSVFCRELFRYIRPSSHEPGVDYFHDIPDDCPFPTEV